MAQHIHKYRRVNIGRDKEYWVMQCQLPGCNHYTPMKSKWSCPQLRGKAAICNTCDSTFLLDRRSLLRANPICSVCIESPKQRRIDQAARFLETIDKASGMED